MRMPLKNLGALAIAAALSLAPATALASSFTDVPDTEWYTPSVEWVSAHHLIQGYPDGRFGVGDDLKRGQLAVILWRDANPSAATFDTSKAVNTTSMRDNLDGKYYTEAVNWAVSKGIINGYGNGIFGVDDPVTADMFVSIIGNYANNEISSKVAITNTVYALTDSSQIEPWALHKVSWALTTGLVQGYPNEGTSTYRFQPLEQIHRERAATILANAYEKGILNEGGKLGDENQAPYVSESGFYKDAAQQNIAHYAVTIKNPSHIFQAPFAVLSITGRDSDGKAVFIDRQYVHLAPTDSQTFAGTTGNGVDFDTIDFQISVRDYGYEPGDATYAHNVAVTGVRHLVDGIAVDDNAGNASTSSVTASADEDATDTGATTDADDKNASDDAGSDTDNAPTTPTTTPKHSFTGYVTLGSTGTQDIFTGSVRVSVIYRDKNDKMIGGDYVYVQHMAPDVPTPFTISNVTPPAGMASYEVTAVPDYR